MPIFISYSHNDKNFVDLLASNLVANNVHVWVDRWELHVGDSILDKIQDALQSSSALLIVLSGSSVESEWCKKELNAGLLRELEEKRVLVMPVLLEDCDMPLFLKDKMYADFRSNYDDGFRFILESIARLTSLNRSRITDSEYNIDWAVDTGEMLGQFQLRLTFIEQSQKYPFTVLTEVLIKPNEAAMKRYQEICQLDLDWFATDAVLETVAYYAENNDLKILLEDQTSQHTQFTFKDNKSDKGYDVLISSRLLGEDTGRDVLFNLSGHLVLVREHRKKAGRPLTEKELRDLGISV